MRSTIFPSVRYSSAIKGQLIKSDRSITTERTKTDVTKIIEIYKNEDHHCKVNLSSFIK